jgi:hypothetical protein
MQVNDRAVRYYAELEAGVQHPSVDQDFIKSWDPAPAWEVLEKWLEDISWS